MLYVNHVRFVMVNIPATSFIRTS